MATTNPPSGLRPRGQARGKRSRWRAGLRSSLWYGLAFVLVLGLAQVYFVTPAGQPIPYSEFKTLLKDGQVADVTIGDADDSRHAQAAVSRRSEAGESRSPRPASTIRS